jgi:6-phosphogluconolactonase (cycloisomerase 2 family)
MVNHLRRLSSVAAVTVLCAMVIAGCSGNPLKITLIVVTPASQSVAVGQTQQYKAMATHHNGKMTDITATATWKSSSTATASISTSGLATAVATGMTQITATQDNITSSPASLTVTAPVLLSIAVTPNPKSIAVGGQVGFTATGTYSDNSQKDITAQVTWNSQTPAVATITSPGGVATGVAVGSSAITATLGLIVSPAVTLQVTSAGGVTLTSVTVSPASPTIAVGQTVDFVATAHYSDSTTKVVSTATWNSDTPATASILSPSGIAIALATGSSGITATFSGVTSTPADTLTVQAAFGHALYAPGITDGNIATYAVNAATAALYPIGSRAVFNSPQYLVLEPSGRFGYLLQDQVLTAMGIDPVTGRLVGLVPFFTVNTSTATGNGAGKNDFGIVDPSGRFLYVVSDSGTTDLNEYTISSSDGTLSHGSAISVGSFPVSVICDRSGKYLYVVDQTTGLIYGYSIDPTTGALTALAPTPSFAAGSGPQYQAIDPSNSHLYVTNSGDSTVSGYTIGADGSLTPITGSPFAVSASSSPEGVVIDASGKYLYVANSLLNSVSVFSIGADGKLGSAPIGTFPAGAAPFGIAIDPTNSMVAVANFVGNTISTYTINAGTGALTAASLPQVEEPVNAAFVTFGVSLASPKVLPGAVYAANAISGDVSAFTSDTSTGKLSAAASSPIAGVAGNSVAAADLTGSLLLVGGTSNVAGFSVNPSTAAASALTGSPQAGPAPLTIAQLLASPTAGFAAALDTSTDKVVQYSVDLSASKLSVTATTAATFAGVANLASDPQGDFIFALGSTGANDILPITTYIPGQTIASSTQSIAYPGTWGSGAVDGSGQYLVAADNSAKILQSFTITAAGPGAGNNGSVTSIGSVGLTGTGPWVVAFDPQDRVVYVADTAALAGTVTPYAFDPTTGTIGAAGAMTNVSANGLTNITVDISGSYLYAGVKAAAAPGSKGAVAVYSIGAAGALTAVTGSPFTTGTGNPGVAATNVVQ